MSTLTWSRCSSLMQHVLRCRMLTRRYHRRDCLFFSGSITRSLERISFALRGPPIFTLKAPLRFLPSRASYQYLKHAPVMTISRCWPGNHGHKRRVCANSLRQAVWLDDNLPALTPFSCFPSFTIPLTILIPSLPLEHGDDRQRRC